MVIQSKYIKKGNDFMKDKPITKISMNIPTDLYIELKQESDKLGVPFSALILFKLKERQEQINLTKQLATALAFLSNEEQKK